MKTVSKTGPLLFRVSTQKVNPEIPAGHVRIDFVRFETVDFPNNGDFDKMRFEILDCNREECKALAELVKR